MAGPLRGASCLPLDNGLKSACHHRQRLCYDIWGEKKSERIQVHLIHKAATTPLPSNSVDRIRCWWKRREDKRVPNRKEILGHLWER